MVAQKNILITRRHNINTTAIKAVAKPFLKWAGGKGQLLKCIEQNLPIQLKNGTIKNYMEPFVGSGAVFFYLQSKYTFQNVTLCDVNKDLVLCYIAVQQQVTALADELKNIEQHYLSLNEENRKKCFYKVREQYNQPQLREFDLTSITPNHIQRAAQTIFLNKTCYNGLYRLNKKGEFNVPFGKYKNPKIERRQVLLNASQALQNAEILCGDFDSIRSTIVAPAFIYYDPPYRPLNKTSSFNAYSNKAFTDVEQKRLRDFMNEIDQPNVYQMLSNSDPKNENANDDYFDELYFNYSINRVPASRQINSKSSNRGAVNELLITSYGRL